MLAARDASDHDAGIGLVACVLLQRLQRLRPAQAMHWDRLASVDGRPSPAPKRGQTTNSYERDWQLILPPFLVQRRADAR